MHFTSINPSTELEVFKHSADPESAINAALDELTASAISWRQTSIRERSEVLIRLSDSLLDNKDHLASLAAVEMGKPLREGVAEVEKCAWTCRFFAENVAEMLSDQPIKTEAVRSYVSYQPLGLIFGIMPWNFPFWQVFRFAIPAVLAGNVVAFKHAPNVLECAKSIGSIVANVWEHTIIRCLICDHATASKIIVDSRTTAVTFTGSSKAGSTIAAMAGKSLKKTVLELGGSDPYVILADCNVEKAAELCVKSRLINSGQSCIAAKRFIVESKIAGRFTEAVIHGMKSRTFGDPLTGEFDIGPIARQDLRMNLHDQVGQSLQSGAALLFGGELPESRGYFYPPTVISSVTPGMRAFDEETFGPVAVIIEARDENEALQLANKSAYGLGAAIFSADIEKAERMARSYLDAGACFINDFVKSDPRMPFGGIKNSGYGRELGLLGVHEFTNAKSIWVS